MKTTENKQQHTPGPWEWIEGAEKHHRELIETADKGQGQDSICYHGADWPMTEANAALIAQAPDLLRQRDQLVQDVKNYEQSWRVLETERNELKWERDNLKATNAKLLEALKAIAGPAYAPDDNTDEDGLRSLMDQVLGIAQRAIADAEGEGRDGK